MKYSLNGRPILSLCSELFWGLLMAVVTGSCCKYSVAWGISSVSPKLLTYRVMINFHLSTYTPGISTGVILELLFVWTFYKGASSYGSDGDRPGGGTVNAKFFCSTTLPLLRNDIFLLPHSMGRHDYSGRELG